MHTVVIVGQNYPDSISDQLVEMHERTVIFEPLPQCAKACHERYPQAIVVQAACGDAFEVREFTVYNDCGLSSSLGTVNDAAKQLYSFVDWQPKQKFLVHVVQPDVVLKGLGIDEIDALIVDAQGMDLAILKRMKPYLGTLKYIQCEAGNLYNGLPENSEAAFMEFMSAYPQYKFHRIPNRLDQNPDLAWELSE